MGTLSRSICMALILALPAMSAFGDTVPAEKSDLQEAIDVLGEEAEASPWTAEIELGATFTSGNTDRRGFSGIVRAERETDEGKIAARFAAFYAEEDRVRSVNEQHLSLREDWKEEDWYYFALLTFERDEFEDLDLRARFAPGAGTTLYDTGEGKAAVEFGPSVMYEDFDAADEEQWTLELRIGLNGEWKVLDDAKLTADIQFYPSLSDTGEYRIDGEIAFENPLSESLFFKLSVIDQYDSSPEDGVKRNDFKLLLSLVYKL